MTQNDTLLSSSSLYGSVCADVYVYDHVSTVLTFIAIVDITVLQRYRYAVVGVRELKRTVSRLRTCSRTVLLAGLDAA